MTQPIVQRDTEVITLLALRGRISCTWQFRQGELDSHPLQVLPDGCVDLIWDGRSVFVAGPDSRVAMASLPPGSVLAGVRLAPASGAGLLGLALHNIADQRVPLADSAANGASTDFEACR